MKQKVGACGIHCGSCRAFRLDHDRCLGCDWANEMLRKSRDSKKGCTFWECVVSKNAECCLACDEFPCQTHYDPKEAIYTKQALDMWKELRKTGLTFWGKREELEKSIRRDPKAK
ncbi:MAG TPA: hypothetical protein VEH86_09060 [Candidatus Acidoferrum sp.]|nr:hypothetical protein [Candidatus Acidoferrum sp.]